MRFGVSGFRASVKGTFKHLEVTDWLHWARLYELAVRHYRLRDFRLRWVKQDEGMKKTMVLYLDVACVIAHSHWSSESRKDYATSNQSCRCTASEPNAPETC